MDYIITVVVDIIGAPTADRVECMMMLLGAIRAAHKEMRRVTVIRREGAKPQKWIVSGVRFGLTVWRIAISLGLLIQ
ncbi:hypothetical protein [Georgenia yuyongxinii]|uniref:Uncharacterized protein n=1 Tax=Georgenia yuyongxinii TaxID=2589797 RepID=A0A552WMZ4_9MICO|nr:hypothetical protein [Georgenia yuyongxinii]TRW44122.1 hypothetical protein FJ693_14965 [Georgenia yuyongxinii]